MYINAVIDTNVLVSGLITDNINSPTYVIIEEILNNNIIPIFNKYIIKEYIDILYKDKFEIDEYDIVDVVRKIADTGIEIIPKKSDIKMIDETDRKFYDAYKNVRDAYLITGNIKHYPNEKRILSPKEFLLEIND